MTDGRARPKLELVREAPTRDAREAAQRASEARRPASRGAARANLKHEMFELICRQMHTFAGRASDFDDLVQSAAEQVLRSLPRFQGRAAPATWTYRICYHTFLKHRRWYSRWLRRFAYAEEQSAVPDSETLDTASDWLEQRERAVRLRVALDQLSPKHRAVVVLHDLDGLQVEEIAAIVGAQVLTVRSRLRDGRRRLARALENDPYFDVEADGTEDIA